ncbi:MAG: HEPN domain-containing protein [Planctomycetes bacterium]|nr:HEPN domain-containing protein [Planctomycetota bacterium]
MSIQEQTKYFMDSAEYDLSVAETLFQNGHYPWCLFIGHLTLEKALKAFFIKDNQKTPPKTHNLVMLSKSTRLALTSEQEQFLDKINDFNIEARYPDIKLQFYKICTKEFTTENFIKIKEFYKWLKLQMT